ncbi:MAG: M23 family metallopeptidase [Saprospiraceae bacterium]|jgi:murein DD-endopeptidase MepM/ murein hydrolase activator NlpD|nr:M23 family metallopeptidase [Saprospiraceae bacterium]
MTLNEKQFQFIQSKLEESGLNFKPVKEELLDHLCSHIELNMTNGDSFSQASKQAFDTFQEDEMQEIEQYSMHLLNQNTVIMKKVSFLTLSLLFFVSLIWAFNVEPPSINPLKGNFKVTAEFGKRMHPKLKVMKNHVGVDFKAPMGTPVLATSDGVIEKAIMQETGYGYHIYIKHDENYKTLYSHLSKIDVVVGQKVKKGDIIGAVGTTGASSGPHLHYEVIKDGKKINPEPYLKP